MNNTYVISDIHGFNDGFRKALKKIRLKKTDELILLGDLIAKGNDSKGVLDTVIELLKEGFDISCIMGDHELMHLKAIGNYEKRIRWLNNGGHRTLESFNVGHLDQVPEKYLSFIESFKSNIERDRFIFVHAGIDMSDPDPFKKEFPLFYMKEWGECYVAGWLDGRKLIHGHTPRKWKSITDDIASDEEIICIDNGSYMEDIGYGNICVLKLETMQVYFEPIYF